MQAIIPKIFINIQELFNIDRKHLEDVLNLSRSLMIQ